jgi:hypothetical protein
MKTDMFEMDGYEGSMDSWSSFGKWVGQLWEGRDELPEFVKKDVDKLIATYGLSRELIGAIYSSVQTKTRYVSIQLGIGGYQTETAAFTANNLYGDCKALSNYLLAMLRYAGFDARPALIRNGGFSFPFDAGFVHNPFNHAVIAVQFEGETIWVEATSSTYPLGYLGSSNSNRHALLFNESGGELVETPDLTPADNYQKRTAIVDLESDGSALLSVSTSYGGSQHERIRSLLRATPDQQDRYVRSRLPFNLFEVNNFEASADSIAPSAELIMDVTVNTFANKIGKRLMFHPNMLERRDNFVSADEDRQQPINISMAYYDVDELTFNLPEGYSVEAIPDSISLEFDFGNYSASIKPSEDGTSLTYVREIAMKPATMQPDEFESFRNIMNQIWKSDNNQVVIVKK